MELMRRGWSEGGGKSVGGGYVYTVESGFLYL